MEVDEIQTQACKFPRIRSDSNKIGQKGEDEDEVELKRIASVGGANDIGRFCGWPSSRIVRVSRASGGKDRHSKVLTTKGLRDRRVRLSVTTAIQFYDLQDRLGYDQPSKAVEWLLKAAASSIAVLPSLNTSFSDTPKQLGDEKRSSGGTTEIRFDSTDHLELDIDPNFRQQQQQNVSLSKSACSSTSETSKGSGGLSLSRSESRIKARERARGRAAEKEKEKESESLFAGHHQNVTSIPQNSSFTELLTGNINSANTNNSTSHKSSRQWRPSIPMDNFASGLNHSSAGFSRQIHLGNSLSQPMMVSPFSVTPGDHHQELQQFSFVPDNLVPVATAAGGSDYNLNFSISSGLAGFNRGTLQSNSPSLLPHLQRFSPIDGSNSPFFVGSMAPNAENHHQHHQFPAGFDGRLQLYYGETDRHSDQKGNEKH